MEEPILIPTIDFTNRNYLSYFDDIYFIPQKKEKCMSNKGIFLSALLSFTLVPINARPHRENDRRSLNVHYEKHQLDFNVDQVSQEQEDAELNKKKEQPKCCDSVRFINQVPFTITKSGKYKLCRNVTYAGPGAAITIEANNVTLNANNHSITLLAPATAILVLGSEVAIENDAIVYKPQTRGPGLAIGIHVQNTTKVNVDNAFFNGFDEGMVIEESNSVYVNNSHFEFCGDNGIVAVASQAVNIKDTTFSDNNQGILFDFNCKDCSVSNVQETNAFAGSFMRWVTGLTIENSVFEINNNVNPNSCLQLGSSVDADAQANDVIIRNCQFINRLPIFQEDPNAGFDGVLFAKGTNAIFENCIIDINAAFKPGNDVPGGTLPYQNGALHISSTLPTTEGVEPLFTQFYANLKVRNCILSNFGNHAVTTENETSNITIESCKICGQTNGVNLIGTTASVIKNNEVQNCGFHGVFLGSSFLIQPEVGSFANNVENNTTANNGADGIQAAEFAQFNAILANKAFNNGGYGINDLGAENRVFNNLAYANAVAQYNGVTVIGVPGDPTTFGGNIIA